MAALPARQHPSTARPVRPEPARPRHRGDISNDTRRHGPRLGQAAPSERGFHQHHHIVPRRPTRPRGRLGSPSPASPTSASSSPRGAAQRRPGITRRDAGGSGARSTTTPAHTSKQHAHFRQHGYTDGAKAILIAQRRRARSAIRGPRALPRRLLDTAHSLTVAYGYRPGRVLWLLAILLVLVTAPVQIRGPQSAMRATIAGAVYTTQGPIRSRTTHPATTAGNSGSASRRSARAARGDGQVRCFNSFLYAFGTVIPLVSPGQRATWYPGAHAAYGTFLPWWPDTATVPGWLPSSIFVLSLAGFARSM